MRSHPTSPREALAGFVLLLVIALGLAPQVARHVAVRQLEARMGTPVRIDDVDMNIFTGHATVTNFVIGGSNGSQPIVRLPRLDLELSQQAFLRGKVAVRSITFHRPQLLIERIEPDRFNVRELMRLGEGPGGGPGWFSMDHAEIEIEGGEVTFDDRTTTPAVTGALRDIQLTVKGLNPAPNAEPGRVKGKARLGKAPVRVTGTLRPRPLATHVTLTATGVRLQAFQDYINAMLGTTNALGGSLDGRLEISLAPRQDGRINPEISGTVEGHNVAFGLPGEQKPLFSAKRITIDLAGTGRTSTPTTEITRIQVVGPTLRLTRNREGNLNLRRLWASPQRRAPAPTPKPAAANPRGPRSRIVIRQLDVSQGRIEFVDATVTPTFTGVLSNISAEVHLQARSADRASLKVQGTLGDFAPLELSGWFTPLERPLRLDLKGTLRNYEVSRLNPYAEKYIGYRIRRGRVTTKGKYTYVSGNLASRNSITFRKVQVGKKVGDEFRKNVGIPLKLALALLRDGNGEIHLRVPVRGNLDNPQFSFEKVIGKAFRKALITVITAPFQVLGKIFTVGGKIGDVRIHPIGFLPGSLEPNRDGRKRLEKLVAFLKSRPKVDLQVRGRATTDEAKALSKRRPHPKGITTQALRTLAEDRARLIERTLVRRGVKPKRLFVVTGDRRAVTNSPPGRVELHLLR